MAGTPPRPVFLHTGFRRVGFSLGFFFKMLLSLRRWPHFRASAPSESCSRCSAGLISALPLVPNRAPAAALASFPRFRSFRIVLPLQRWPHFCGSGCSKTCSRCSADVFDPSKEAPNLENDPPKKTIGSDYTSGVDSLIFWAAERPPTFGRRPFEEVSSRSPFPAWRWRC